MPDAQGAGPVRYGRALKILSIDGGGIRGIIPSTVLIELERITGRRIATMFDLIAGTSTGGLVALATTLPGRDGQPAMSAEEVLRLFTEDGPRIFPKVPIGRRRGHRITGPVAPHLSQRLGSVLRPRRFGNARYLPDGLEETVRRLARDIRLTDVLADVLVPSYDMVAGRPVVFSSRAAREGSAANAFIRDVALATTAAPTFFPPARLSDGSMERVLVDGATVANNPAVIAYYEALHREHAEGRDLDVIMVSLGSGAPPHDHVTYEDVWSKGWLKLAMGMFGVFMDGTSEITDHLLREVLTWREPHSRYWRFQPEIIGPTLDLDDASPANINALLRLSDQLVAERSTDLVEIAQLITAEQHDPTSNGAAATSAATRPEQARR